MHNEFTFIIEQDGEWFVAYSPEIPGANGQGRSPTPLAKIWPRLSRSSSKIAAKVVDCAACRECNHAEPCEVQLEQIENHCGTSAQRRMARWPRRSTGSETPRDADIGAHKSGRFGRDRETRTSGTPSKTAPALREGRSLTRALSRRLRTGETSTHAAGKARAFETSLADHVREMSATLLTNVHRHHQPHRHHRLVRAASNRARGCGCARPMRRRSRAARVWR